MAKRKLGIAVVGLGGAVGTTMAAGVELCDIQLISDHTRRLGAVEIPARQFERRLSAALRR